ncbi:MAG: cell surface protein SprA [Paludibacteraceae bacterium]|nr:cell surface protein SprA [Paludibacteraceae bacterium]
MKKYTTPAAVLGLIALSATSAFAVPGDDQPAQATLPAPIATTKVDSSATDSVRSGDLIYPLRKSEIVTYEDLQEKSAADLKDPSNVHHEVDYDPENGYYIYRTKVGDMEVSTPFVLNESEYQEQSLRESMNNYWDQKNAENQDRQNSYSLENLHVDIGNTGDKIFGPGGVQLKTQGSVDLTFGLKHTVRKNPTISERNRKSTIFDFDTKIQLNATGKVGDRVKFTMNYNTEASFEADQQLINLSYEGKEDNIVKKVEAGNVSLPLSTQLIQGASSLFGIRTDLQYGKLKVSAIAAQQESERKTVHTKGGGQNTEFEFSAADYEANKHFFLSPYFKEHYDEWMKDLPVLKTGIVINRIEVWVTNSSTQADRSTRNVVALRYIDYDSLYYYQNRPNELPSNKSGHYKVFKQDPNNLPENWFINGENYEKINNARMLRSDEYVLNPNLGYISLRSTLNPSDVIAVAYEYTTGDGKTHYVGELTTSVQGDTISDKPLAAKLLKGTNTSPSQADLWDLMMKNVYNLQAYSVSPNKFKLEVEYYYSNDSLSTYMKYLPEGAIAKKPLIKLMDLDRLNSKRKASPDGYYDFVDGYTVDARNGRVIFPTVEPFGRSLIEQIKRSGGSNALAEKFAFTELYDSLQVDAKEFTEKNKFIIRGSYQSASGSKIRLNATNVPRGSVRVTAGGRLLTENEDYTVNYQLGEVTILNDAIASGNTPISVSLEDESAFSTQRKSLLGTTLQYGFNDHFTLGGTIMHLNEKPLTQKVGYGEDPISNTIWGLNAAFTTPSQWLTDMIDKLPLINATAPSSISLSGEFAQLIPGHADGVDQNGQGVSYIDDFEGTKSSINIMSPYSWTLASTPKISSGGQPLIRETDAFWGADLNTSKGHLGYGLNRSHFAWFRIDQVLNNPTSETPRHLRTDNDQQSNHFVRLIHEQEIFHNKEAFYGESTILPTLNLSFYPKERGPYCLDVSGMQPDGTLDNPTQRWGGIMRKLENTDFKKSNVEYIELWMMDPFVYDTVNTSSGRLVFNLGEVSEDVLHDGKLMYENGMPINENDEHRVDSTIWGRVPRTNAIVYAFDLSNLDAQDLGLNGLSSDAEKYTGAYGRYLQALESKLNASAKARFNDQIMSPLSDPAGDDFVHFLDGKYSDRRASILDRYKYYNGMENNSSSSSASYSSSSNTPDTEDLNGDKTLNEKEQYYEYVLHIDKDIFADSTRWKENRIASCVNTTIKLKNGERENIRWYQIKIPIAEYDRKEGSINGFQSIRYIRMYMTGFEDETFLRFGAMNLVRTDWRVYSQNKNLFEGVANDGVNSNEGDGRIAISAVNIENDADKLPVAYTLPPGISRVIDPSQTQVRQENEQSMLLEVDKLGPKQARAVYKNTTLDTRRYKRMRMFVHAENRLDADPVSDNRLYLFLRLGNDLTENYYEYQVPLVMTAEGATRRDDVWPVENEINFPFELFTNLKLKRDRLKASGQAHVNERYTEMDGRNIISVVGMPSFGEIESMMIGIRNEDNETHSADIWVNELRMEGFDEDGGCAGLANLGIVFSDLGSVSVGGRIEQAGFGSIEDNVDERLQEDHYRYNWAANVQLGKLFPEKAKVNLPFTYTFSKDIERPEYDPMNTDIKLDESLDNAGSESERKKIKENALTTSTFHSYTLNNVRVGITSEKPMPYDPANFSMSLSYDETTEKSPEVEYDVTRNYMGSLHYNYTLSPKPVEPFRKMKAFKSNNLKLIREFNFYYLPNSLAFSTTMRRYYNEVQLRELTTGYERSQDFDYLSWDKDFTWNRTSDIKWNLSRSLKLNFNTNMNAEINEVIKVRTDSSFRYIDVPVNKSYLKEVSDDWYEKWKDEVWSEIHHFGSPLAYNQRLSLSWTVPINKLPYLDWISSNAQYTADYNWDRGAISQLGSRHADVGNIAQSRRQWNGDVRFNLETLYNKSSYLKGINKKFVKQRNIPQGAKKSRDEKPKDGKENEAKKDTKEKKAKEKPQPKVYERKNIRLRKGNNTRISHRLGTNKLKVALTDKDGKEYIIKHKVIDENTINLIGTEDVSGLSLRIEGIIKERTPLNDVLDVTARVLMSVRNVSASYREVDGLTLTGYRPESGFLGQDGSAPGYDYTFGFYKAKNFFNKAIKKGWLFDKDNVEDNNVIINPAVITKEQDLQVKASIVPFPGLKLDLNGAWMKTRADQFYVINDLRHSFSGSASKTTIGFGTAFSGKSYNSKLFSNFLKNTETSRNNIVNAMRKEYNSGTGDFEPNRVPLYSSDVLVPAFVSAYTGRSMRKDPLDDIIPQMTQFLPNWRLTVDLLSRWSYMQGKLKSFNLNHSYKCTQTINAYNSYTEWTGFNGYNSDFGIVSTGEETDYNGLTTSNYYYAASYAVDNVTINESFSPLIGADATLNNSLTLKAEWKKSRNCGLDVPAIQVVESYSDELVFGTGYRIDDFGAIVHLANQKQKMIKNDLNLRLDVSYKMTDAFVRKIDTELSERTSGINSFIIKFVADYVVSSRLNFRFYYDRTASTPKASTSYPMVTSDFGLGIRLLLNK